MSNWIAVQVLTGKEKWIAKDISRVCHIFEVSDHILEIRDMVKRFYVYHTETVKYEAVLPSYILINCNLTDMLWHAIKNTPGVIRILKGFAIEDEVNKLLPLSESECEVPVDNQTYSTMVDKYKKYLKVKKELTTKTGLFRVINGPKNIMKEIINKFTVITKKPYQKILRQLLSTKIIIT